MLLAEQIEQIARAALELEEAEQRLTDATSVLEAIAEEYYESHRHTHSARCCTWGRFKYATPSTTDSTKVLFVCKCGWSETECGGGAIYVPKDYIEEKLRAA